MAETVPRVDFKSFLHIPLNTLSCSLTWKTIELLFQRTFKEWSDREHALAKIWCQTYVKLHVTLILHQMLWKVLEWSCHHFFPVYFCYYYYYYWLTSFVHPQPTGESNTFFGVKILCKWWIFLHPSTPLPSPRPTHPNI